MSNVAMTAVAPGSPSGDKITLASYKGSCFGGGKEVSLVGKQIRVIHTNPDLLCCCNTENERDVDLRHVFAVGRYTPSCWRKFIFCCFAPCSAEGVTFEYGSGRSEFIQSGDSKNIMVQIQNRIDQLGAGQYVQ